MTYVARRLMLSSGERSSLLVNVETGLPVLKAALYVETMRRAGLAASTIHQTLCSIALLYRFLAGERWLVPAAESIDLDARLRAGKLLSPHEVTQLADLTRSESSEITARKQETAAARRRATVVSLDVLLRKPRASEVPSLVCPHSTATRLMHIAGFLRFVALLAEGSSSDERVLALRTESSRALNALKLFQPKVGRRNTLKSRPPLTAEEERELHEVIAADSPRNPWAHPFVRRRNELIVKLLFAGGMRRSELLGIKISDLGTSRPKLLLLRRADDPEDPRVDQPCVKTRDREIEIPRDLAEALQEHVRTDRRAIRRARRRPQLFVSTAGEPLSKSALDALFRELRAALPPFGTWLTAHVLRISWNDRLSRAGEEMKLDAELLKRARHEHQGWSETSHMSSTYDRAYTQEKAIALSLAMQARNERKANG